MKASHPGNPGLGEPGVVSRRTWLKSLAGGLVLSVGSAGLVRLAQAEEPKRYGRDSMPGGVVDNPLVFVSIAPDGIVTIVAHRAEMGTGIRTSLPMVVADEMEADWSRVRIVQADGDEARYGSQNVDGSRSMRHFLEPMRRVGASARAMLEAAAAARWKVPVDQVQASLHEVVHKPTGRRLGYGTLAVAAQKQPVPQPAQLRLKDPARFRYIGKGQVMPFDGADIATGRAQFGIDTRLPGMVYAVMARPPVYGGKLRSVDANEALQVPGVIKVLEIPGYPGAPLFNPLGGVAVVARNTWAAIKGREALKLQWEDGPNAGYDSAVFKGMLETAARQSAKALRSDGDAAAAISQAPQDRRLSAEYYVPHLAHASMEPPVATARFVDGKCEIWAPVQAPQGAVDSVAKHLGLTSQEVTLHVTLLGGGFGRKSMPDFVSEAALVSKSMEGVLGEQGRPTAWLHRTAAPSIVSTFVPGGKGQADFEAGMTAINVPYVIPNLRIEAADVDAHARIGWFRSVSNIPHAFAVQSFVAELAAKAGRDPREYLLELIGPPRRISPEALADKWNYTESPELYPIDTGRMRRVVEEATKAAGWGRKLAPGHGLGLAMAYSFVTYTAAVVEVDVNEQGEIRIPRVDMAIDCGPQVNPERIRSQVEGGCVMGLGLALLGEITFKNGRVEQSNFHDYEVARSVAAPRAIHVHLVGNDFSVPPGGVGEPPVPPMAPALCNAIFAATGKRIRQLPIRDQLTRT